MLVLTGVSLFLCVCVCVLITCIQPLANQHVLFVMLENLKQVPHKQFATLVRVAGIKVLLVLRRVMSVHLATINPALFQWHATSARLGSTPV